MPAITPHSTRQPGRRSPDLSLLRQHRAYKETPDFLSAAVRLGRFVSCPTCQRVVGVGSDRENAVRNSLNENLGVRKGDQIFCTDHAGGNES